MQALERQLADTQGLAFLHADIDARQTVDCRRGDLAARLLFQFQCAGDVIGMDMRVQRVGQRQPELVQFRQVAVQGRNDGIDQHRLASAFTAEQIRVGTGKRLV